MPEGRSLGEHSTEGPAGRPAPARSPFAFAFALAFALLQAFLAPSPFTSYPIAVSYPLPETLPPGYGAARVGGALVVARAQLLPPVIWVVTQHGSLHAWAAARPGAKPLAGRGVAWAVDAPDGADTPGYPPRAARWGVRHYRRGGGVRWLGDRYLRLGLARPLRELRTSVAARARGVRTPEVLALAVYPAVGFYRADLVTAEIAGAMDLAEALWAEHPAAGDPDARLAALLAAGALLRQLAEAGVRHPDLNAKNILLAPPAAGDVPARGGDPVVAWALDLDGCVLAPPPLSRRRLREAYARLERSLRKWERRTRRPLSAREWQELQATMGPDPIPAPVESAHA